jgi:arginine-tRNA-protein transferase
MGDRSFVYWYSTLERHLCGYCKNEQGNVSHGMWAKTLTVEDYQNLIDRGWRRSGNYCYKPLMNEICCPMYTIKCNVLNFQLSKSQKKVVKKFNKFLKDGVLNKNENHPVATENSDNIAEFFHKEAPAHLSQELHDSNLLLESDKTVVSDTDNQSTSQSEHNAVLSKSEVRNAPAAKSSVETPKTGVGADPNKPPCKKAKVLRMERKKEKLLKRGMSLEKINVKSNEQKTVEEFLNDVSQDNQHKLKLELINTGRHGKEWEKLKRIEFALYKKYQMCVHNDPPEKCTMEGFLRFLVNSPLQVSV